MDWRERIRSLWVERAVWTRHYIISLMMGLRDLSFVATRLLRNGTELARIISHFYGTEIAIELENLLTQNSLLLAELASTVKLDGDITPMQASWNAIAEELLALLIQINPYTDRALWEKYINDQIKLQKDLVLSLSKERYAEGIANFDLAYENATNLARQMIEGIEAQFNLGLAFPQGMDTSPISLSDTPAMG